MSDDFSSGDSPGSKKNSTRPTNASGEKLIRPRKNRHLTNASDVLQGLLENSKSQLGDGFLRWRLEQQWRDVVGATIAAQTLPCAYSHGTLHIWVRHSAWMQQLWYFQDPIREKVNSHLGRDWVKQVRFTLSRRAAVGDEPGAQS